MSSKKYLHTFFKICVLVALFVGESNGQSLAHSAVLDADGKFHVAWDFSENDITFEVSVNSRGYFGLGFSPNGGMAGSDIVIGWVDDISGQGHLSDRHAVGESTPLVDINSNYDLIASSQNGTHTQLRFSRLLSTCDDDDASIKDETVRLIWAYNDMDPGKDGEPSYHGTNRGVKSVFLLNPQKVLPSLPADRIEHEFLNPRVLVPDAHTTYWCQAFAVPMFSSKHHVIKIDPIIHPGLESEIHHILLYGCYHEIDNNTVGMGDECYQRNMPQDFHGCSAVIYAWAIGDGSFYFPEHAGLPFSYEGDPTMILMETHYNNPERKSGLIDSSGVRFILTPTLRTHDAGLLEAGVAIDSSHVIPPNSDSFQTNGYCFPDCLTQGMENNQDEIKVFAVMLHAHLLGHAIKVRHFRGGREQPAIGEDDNYDFDFQQTRLLAEEAQVVPGDHFIVECYYRSSQRTTVTYGGLPTTDEMCLGFLYYYPKIPLSVCLSEVTTERLGDIIGVKALANGTLTSPSEHAGTYIYDYISNDVDWREEEMRNQLEEGINKEGVDGYRSWCMNGRKWYPVMTSKLPKTLETRPEEERTCASTSNWLTASVSLNLASFLMWFSY